jgi:tetratricopeptide (TPR) repeat protein
MNAGKRLEVAAGAIVAALAFGALVAAAPASPGPSATAVPTVVGSPAPAPSASPTPTAAQLFSQAQVDAASGRNAQALDEVKRAFAMDPTDLDIERLLGDVQYRLEQYTDAEASYKDVLAHAPDDRSLHNRLGGVYAAEGRIDDAIHEFRLSLPSQEGTDDLIQVYSDKGDLKDLESEFQLDVDRAAPDDPYTRLELANVLEAEKKYPEAMDVLQAVLQIDPNLWQAHNELGITLGDVGEYDQAIAQYKIAIAEDQRCFLAWMNWGVELVNMGNNADAVAKIQKSIDIFPQFAKGYANLGVAESNLGDFQKALEMYQRALSFDPRLPEVYVNLGVDYFEHGLYNLAEAAFVKGIALNPRYAKLHTDLGFYYQQREQYDKAIEQYKIALSIDGTDQMAKDNLAEVESLVGH